MEISHCPKRCVGERDALRGQLDPASAHAGPGDGCAKPTFELAQGPADGRVLDPEPACGGTHAAFGMHDSERAKMGERKIAHGGAKDRPVRAPKRPDRRDRVR